MQLPPFGGSFAKITYMDKASRIMALKNEIIEQKICSDLAAGATPLVMGDGNLDSQIVFIGEAPGKNEDLQGKPFVGASGKFLDEMLTSVGLNRSDIYITNIVKYRPPNNRDPLPDEKRSFWPYLMRQLEIINPTVIVTLGRHAMDCFIPGAKISVDHGRPRKVQLHRDGAEYNWLVMPLYHPAAALYNGSMRQTLMDDFQKVKDLINQLSLALVVLTNTYLYFLVKKLGNKKILAIVSFLYLIGLFGDSYYGFLNSTKPFEETVKSWNNLITNNISLIPALAFYKTGNIDKYAKEGINEWIEYNNIISREVMLSRELSNYKGFAIFRYDSIFGNNLTENAFLEKENLKNILY